MTRGALTPGADVVDYERVEEHEGERERGIEPGAVGVQVLVVVLLQHAAPRVIVHPAACCAVQVAAAAPNNGSWL